MADKPNPQEIVIGAMDDVADVYGFRKSYAHIYGALYFSTEAMTMDELSRDTDFAKSTVSDALNKLEDLHLAHSEKREGHGKTKFFTAEEDLEEAMKKFMDDQATNEIQIMLDALEEAEEKAEKGSIEEKKIRNLKNFYEKSKKLITLFKKLPSGKTLAKATESLKSNLSRFSGKDS